MIWYDMIYIFVSFSFVAKISRRDSPGSLCTHNGPQASITAKIKCEDIELLSIYKNVILRYACWGITSGYHQDNGKIPRGYWFRSAGVVVVNIVKVAVNSVRRPFCISIES